MAEKDTLDVHFRSLNKNDFDAINLLRKQRKFTWSELFKHLNIYNTSFRNILNRNSEQDICSIKSAQTLAALLPKWCENTAYNMQDILKYGDISYLVCNTRKYNRCHKIDKMREMVFDKNKEYEVEEIAKTCGFPMNYMDYLLKQVHTCNFVSIAGSGLCTGCKEQTAYDKSTPKKALIIGGGPSLKTHNHLELLKKYGFNGDIFVVGKVLKEVLEAGIIPDYVGALDAEEADTSFFDHEIVDKYSDKITALFGTTAHPTTVQRWKGKKYFFTGYIGEAEAANISHIFHLFTKTTVLSVSGNIGSCMANVASYLGYNRLILIGMDLSFPTLKDMKEYFPSASNEDWKKKIVYNGKERPMYKRGYNPEFKKQYYIDSVFESYKVSHLSWARMFAEEGHMTINCTEQGSLHGKYIKSMKFEDYLKNQNDIPLFEVPRTTCLDFWRRVANYMDSNNPHAYAKKQTEVIDILTGLWTPYINKNDSIIEIGCNSGVNLNHLLKLGYTNLKGIDINKKAFSVMKEEFPELYNKCITKTGDLEEILPKLSDNENDVTLSIAVLQHITKENDPKIFEDIYRTTKKYIVLIEKETNLDRNIMFSRNYKSIFENIGCETLIEKEINEDICTDKTYEGYKLYVFKKK